MINKSNLNEICYSISSKIIDFDELKHNLDKDYANILLTLSNNFSLSIYYYYYIYLYIYSLYMDIKIRLK